MKTKASPRILGSDGKKLPPAPKAPGLKAEAAEWDLAAFVVHHASVRPFVIEMVAPSDFENAALGRVWEVAQILWRSGQKSLGFLELEKNLVCQSDEGEYSGTAFDELLNQLDGRGGELFDNRDLALGVARLVVDASAARAVVSHSAKLQDAAMSGHDFRPQLAELSRAAAKAEFRDFSSIDDSLVADFAVKPTLPIPTGFGELDRDLGGGMAVGTYNVLAGGTGIGKTGFALDLLLYNCRQQTHCLYLGTELTRAQITARIAAKYLRIDFRDIEKWGGREDVANIIAAVPAYVYKYLRFYRVQVGDSISGIVDSYIAKTGNKPFVVIDHAGDLVRQAVAKAAIAGKRVDTVAATSQVSLELRELTVRQNICALAIMPTSRAMPKELDPETQTGRVFEACAKGSSDVEYDSSNLFYLLRKDDGPQNSKVVDAYLAIAKNRRGPNSVLKFKFEVGTGTFENIASSGESSLSELASRIINVVETNYTGSLSQNALFREIGGNRKRFTDELNNLIRTGRITKTASGGYVVGRN